jgi:N-acylneuraminate cytidylyltransferase
MANCIAIIPARCGSKSIKDKNLASLGPFPLIAYSIAAAKLAKHVDRVIVSTDSQEYADLAVSYGAEVPFLRPATLADDRSTDYDFMQHAIEYLESKEGDAPEYWVHLRPTTPLRDPAIIDQAIEQLMSRNDATALRSGHMSPESPFKWFRKNHDGFFVGLTTDDTNLDKFNGPRQEFPDVLIPDGYVDVVRRSFVVREKLLHGNKVLGFESPFCIEVDSIEELDLLGYQLEKNGSPLLDYLRGVK